MVVRASAILVALVALVAACGGPRVYIAELRSPIPSPSNDCEGAYLAWITAPRIEDMEHSHDEMRMSALKPVFEACDIEHLAAASERYPRWGCTPPPGTEHCWFEADLPADPSGLADLFQPYCDGSAVPYMDLEGTLEQTLLCRDFARYLQSVGGLPPEPARGR